MGCHNQLPLFEDQNQAAFIVNPSVADLKSFIFKNNNERVVSKPFFLTVFKRFWDKKGDDDDGLVVGATTVLFVIRF